MGLTVTLILVVLGLLEVVAYVMVWRANRRLDAMSEEFDAQMTAHRAEMEEKFRALDQRIEEVAEEMRERIRDANRRLDETIETQRLMEDLKDINDRVRCLRTPGGMSKRVRRSDHRQ